MAGLELLRPECFDWHAHMLFLASGVGKAQVDEFDIFIFDRLKNLFRGHFFSSKPKLCLMIPRQRKRPTFCHKTKKALDLKLNRRLRRRSAWHHVVPKSLCFYNSDFLVVSTGKSKKAPGRPHFVQNGR